MILINIPFFKTKKIANEDAYILITGKLKIFEFIKLEKKIINMIEFIDLPGADNKNNTFKEGEYDEKILAFTNCCIYVNAPNTYLDSISHENMINRYRSDKEKVFITLRNDFKTCIFLINKLDLLEEEDDKENNQKKKIVESLVKNIKAIENNITEENINYSFFSAESFEYYLFIYKYYVQYFETNILILLNYLYKEWKKCKSYLLFKKYNFKDFVIKKNISVIEEKLNLEEQNEDEDEEDNENNEKEGINEKNEIKEINQNKIPDNICQQFKEAINIIFKEDKKEISESDKNEILKHLYQLYNKIKNNNFDKTIYSWSFFNKLKEVILFSQNLYNKNFKNSMEDFFSNLDFLFMKKISDTIQKCENFDIIIQKVKDLFDQKRKKFSDILESSKNISIQLIDNEIKNIKDRLIEVDYDLDKAIKLLYEKLNNISKDTNEKIQNENQTFSKEIEDLVGEIEQNLTKSLSLEHSGISTIKPIVKSFFTSYFLYIGGGTMFDIIIEKFGIDLVAKTAYSLSLPSMPISGPLGPAISQPIFYNSLGAFMTNPITAALLIGVCLAPLGYSIYKNVFDKEGKYKEKLEQVKKDIKKRYNDMNKSLGKDLKTFKFNIINNIEKRTETLKKKIKTVDEIKWKKMQEDYFKFKDNIKNKIEYLIGN